MKLNEEPVERTEGRLKSWLNETAIFVPSSFFVPIANFRNETSKIVLDERTF